MGENLCHVPYFSLLFFNQNAFHIIFLMLILIYFLQADVCHSYQVVHNHGIPDEQIVVMMFDDIADAEE